MVATLSSRISFSSGVGSRLSSSILTDSVSREMRKRRTSSSNLSRPEAESERSRATYQCLYQWTQLIFFETRLKELSNILIFFPWMVIYLESFCPKWSTSLSKSDRKNNFMWSPSYHLGQGQSWGDLNQISLWTTICSNLLLVKLNSFYCAAVLQLNCNWTMSILYIS